MKKHSILCSIFTFLMVLFSVTGFAQINTNGGFEDWTGTWPAGWNGSKTNINASYVVRNTTDAHSGNNACQLINDTTVLRRFTMQPVAVTTGEQYQISLWAKGHGDLRLGVFNGSSNYIYQNYHYVDNDQYEYYVDTLTITNTMTNAEFIVAVKNTVGDDGHLLIDDVNVSLIVDEDFVATPTAVIEGNMLSSDLYIASATVSLSTLTEGADIYYTLDGSDPTASSSPYSAPITITTTTTLKAIAMLNGNSSDILTKTITIVSNPLFFEDFETNGLNEMTVENISADTYAWGTATRSGNTYAYANAYNHGATETWLITPAITPLNAGGVVLSFITANNYTGPDIQVKYSNNYSGTGDPTTATWTDITSECALSSGSWTWTESGDVEIAGASPIYFAWVYTSGSEANTAAGWEVDNIMVLPGNSQVTTPTLTITAPVNGSTFSTLDTLPLGIDYQNFVLGTDGYIKVESPLLTLIGWSSPIYINADLYDMMSTVAFSPLPAGTHTITCSLVDMDYAALNPAVNATTTFTVVAPEQNAPVITATGEEAESDNTFYFNATINMTADEGASIYYTTNGTEPTEASTLFTEPFQITTTSTIKAMAVKPNYQNSNVSTLEVTITSPTVATPVFTPVAGTYADSVSVSLACTTDDAEIRYTIDGTEPTEASTLYTAPILLTATTTVKAKAFKTAWFASETATAAYTVVFEPVLTVDATTLNFTSTQLTQTFTVGGAHLDEAITLTCNDTHFTVNPASISEPNTNTVVTVTFDGSEPATGLITIVSDTLSAQVALSATAQLPAPVLTPATGEDTLITVTMSCNTVSGVAIHYTMDGTDPTAESATYNAPIVLDTPGTYTVKALTVKTGWENSDIVTGTYVINEPPVPDTVGVPVITPAAGLYYEPQTVTITAEEGAVIRYTTDGSTPTENSTLYTAPFTVNTTTTITAKAWKTDMIPSGTATVTINFPEQVANIAEFKAAAATNVEKQIMSDVTFVFRSGRYIFVEDNTAALLIYDKANANAVITTQYNEGDVIQGGIFGKYKLYNGMVELEPTHNTAPAIGTPVTVTPANTTVSDIKAQYSDVYECKLVHLSDVVFIDSITFVQNGDTMTIYNRFNTFNTHISAGDTADVTGFVSYFVSNSGYQTYQIFPRGNEDVYIHPVVVMDTVATPEFFFQRDGEFYRMYLTCATEGASMYYTIDGTDPDENDYAYTDEVPFYLNVHYTIKAIAMKEGMINSAIATYDYNPASINQYELRDNLVVYPNPAVNNVVISAKDGDLAIEKVELYNIYGQLLNTMNVNDSRAELYVGALSTGTYFAKVFTDKGVTTMPVIRK